MQITIVAVGKIKEKYMSEAISDYVQRLSKYCKINICETDEDSTVKKEGISLLKRIPSNSFVITLDLAGEEYTSESFAAMLDKTLTNGYSAITFVIGGSDGISEDILERANIRVCMSKFTFTHQMARLIILEQIYRAMKINHGEKYHK